MRASAESTGRREMRLDELLKGVSSLDLAGKSRSGSG
jgi:hypothetical protein